MLPEGLQLEDASNYITKLPQGRALGRGVAVLGLKGMK
jgi:hypothetical protein